MPGLVAAVAVTEGQSVAEGDRMVVLEAMKMEHVLRAPRSGIVAQVAVTAGDQVKAGVALVTLAPEDAA
ncbi:MAG: biotin/lipoyl-binding protein [Alphaproteobacteria bacterium]|jgi:3-methylcrotonyl-CoA carboxylase alpha subunit|nr:biotin/lipoyl-binding protein [Alphaproteobacteria bacterium]